MKKCPNGHEVADSVRFCPTCGAELKDGGAKFCKKCGNERRGTEKFCSKCGTPFEGMPTPQPIPQSTPSIDATETSTDYRKIIIPVVIGLVVLALVGGVWYGYREYSIYRAAKAAREKFVADSLEKVRQDSIILAAKQNAEYIEKEKIAMFRKKFIFSNILALLTHPENASFAQKCGLSLIYKDSEKVTNDEEGSEEGDYFTYYDYVYGYEIEKGQKHDGYLGYDIKATSNHSCFFNYVDGCDIVRRFRFKDKSDADYLFEIAKNYGLIESDGLYFIPKMKISTGITHYDEYNPYNENNILFSIRKPSKEGDWYDIIFTSYNLND